MRIGSLFSGYGGLDLGVLAVLGGSVTWHVEVGPDASRVLAHHWPEVPNLGDITRVDWSQVDPVDVLTGGFPCQDVSSAGKRAGLRPGTRSGLWSQMAYAVSVLRPRLVIAENVRGLLSASAASQVEPCPWCLGDDTDHAVRALGAVLGDLADLGYDTAWCGLRAADVGAPHARYRIFVAAIDTVAVDTAVDTAADTRRYPRPEDHPHGATPPGRGRQAAADTDGDRHVQAQRAGPGDAPSGGALRPHRGRGAEPADSGVRHQPAPPDSAGERHRHTGPPSRDGVHAAAVASDQRGTAADPESERRRQRRAELPVRQRRRDSAVGGLRAAPDTPHGHKTDQCPVGAATSRPGRRVRGEPGASARTGAGHPPARVRELGAGSRRVDFGGYEPAIQRWEHLLGRRAPAPTIEGRRGARVLNPAFVEWMQGLADGHVTGVPGLSRNAMLRMLGNGVVPQQAAAALPWLLGVLDAPVGEVA